MNIFKKLSLIGLLSTTIFTASNAHAELIYWADWESGTVDPTSNRITEVNGTMTTSTSVIDVSYANPQGIHFLQTGTGVDYFNSFQDPSISPYTSALVDNTPTASEMIALNRQGSQTLNFSESVANLVFSYVSLNLNGYAFDQDFDILSYGGLDGNVNGYFGAGSSYKQVIDLGNGDFEYRLLGTGEPHGTIQFTGSFTDVSWRSLSDETWNGFTVGIQGTSEEVFDEVPEPSSIALLGLGLLALIRKTLKIRS